jgi:hypothetical protein
MANREGTYGIDNEDDDLLERQLHGTDPDWLIEHGPGQ